MNDRTRLSIFAIRLLRRVCIPRVHPGLLLVRDDRMACTDRVYGIIYDEEFIDAVSIMLCATPSSRVPRAPRSSTLGFRVPSSRFKLVTSDHASSLVMRVPYANTTAPVSLYAKLLICRLNRHFCIAFRSPKRRGGRSLIGRVHARLFDRAVTRAHLDIRQLLVAIRRITS